MMDVTSQFHDIIREKRHAGGLKTPAKEIMKPRYKPTAFTQIALDIVAKIKVLQTGIVQYRQGCAETKKYSGSGGAAAEREKDALEKDLGFLLKQCLQIIDRLNENVDLNNEDITELDRGAVSGRKDEKKRRAGAKVNPQTRAHRLGMIMYLNERLQGRSQQFEQARSVRLEQALKTKRRLVELDALSNSHTDIGSTPFPSTTRAFGNNTHLSTTPLTRSKSSPAGTSLAKGEDDLDDAQQLALELENRALHNELNCVVDLVRETERSMMEIVALQNKFNVELDRQARDIERLYDEAVHSTENIKQGNRELLQATQRGVDFRIMVLFFMLLASATLLFLSWYE